MNDQTVVSHDCLIGNYRLQRSVRKRQVFFSFLGSKMGGSVSQVFQSGSALLSNGHGHKVSESTRQKVQHIFEALRARPRVSVALLEGFLQQIPKNENLLMVYDEAGYNLLQKCVGANNVDLVRWILARHTAADVNRCPCSLPLHIACLKGFVTSWIE